MGRRDEWRKILDAEVNRWSALSWDQLLSELREPRAYEIENHSGQYQVEVQLLENTADYLNVAVSVDDGTLPASIVPATRTFLRVKHLSP